jgi:hypothetical protein
VNLFVDRREIGFVWRIEEVAAICRHVVPGGSDQRG